ncbi:hypothetical protein N0V93_006282 [Gnomoniopsis smithogilvyi]|uniref:Uncharacterized protein n=1 Tax=Gnomoniopsis smithogilvyi TaxID=1191159 RepID=A0A9W9CVJ8_9PEZI|nr:hypothetical protein N0V93_006282 [Gnomoniopsis smithogilvyi]
MPDMSQNPIRNAGNAPARASPGQPQEPDEQAQQIPHNPVRVITPRTAWAQLNQQYGEYGRILSLIPGLLGPNQQMVGHANDQNAEVDNTAPRGDAQPAAAGQPSTMFNRPSDPPNLAHHGPPLAQPPHRPLPVIRHVVAEVPQPAPPPQPQSQGHLQHARGIYTYSQVGRVLEPLFQRGSHHIVRIPRSSIYVYNGILERCCHATRIGGNGVIYILFCWEECCQDLRSYVEMPPPFVEEE